MDEGASSSATGWRLADDGRIHRMRRMKYPNGDEYNGELVDGLRDGSGQLKTAKFIYKGSFHRGLFDGEGIMIWSEFKENGVNIIGRRFEGRFHRGKREGKGMLVDGRGGIWEGMWKDDSFSGRGKVTKSNGEFQEGVFVNGRLHCSAAKIRFENGDVYEGSMHFGTLHSSEVAHISYGYGNGYYTGQFHYNQKQGIGTRRYIDGSIYRGNFESNNISGHGTMHYNEGSDNPRRLKTYSGEWKDGKFHGIGELSFMDNCEVKSYQGEFYQGMFHKRGKITYRDGGYYEGEFSFKDQTLASFPCIGTKHGQGTRLFASGNTFEGIWANDEMVEGKHFDIKYCSTYVGTFVNNKKCGSGREIWRSPDKKSFRDCLGWTHKGNETCTYIGAYKNGYFHGKGAFTSVGGRSYHGEWKLGRQHGHGIAVLLPKFQIGDPGRMFIGKYGSLYKPLRYEGEWKDGLRHGKGKLTFLDGSIKEGNFVHGHFVGYQK